MKNKFTLFILFLVFTFVQFMPLAQAKDKVKVINDTPGVWVFKINTKKYGNKIKPFVTKRLETTTKVYEDNCFDLVVNGGFFDLRSGASVSYVTIDNELKSDVEENTRLVKNLKNQDRLDKVLSRTEFRILENKKHKLKFDIARHTDKTPKGYAIKHALQAGPMLYPSMDLVEEGFVVYDKDVVKHQSVDILKRRERTALGLKGKYLYIVLFTKDYKVDANEMRDYLKEELKIKKAMALDGGWSTSLNYKNISIGSLGRGQRKVKSFIVIER